MLKILFCRFEILLVRQKLALKNLIILLLFVVPYCSTIVAYPNTQCLNHLDDNPDFEHNYTELCITLLNMVQLK